MEIAKLFIQSYAELPSGELLFNENARRLDSHIIREGQFLTCGNRGTCCFLILHGQ